MSKALSSLLRICFYTLGLSLAQTQISLAQVTSDNTVNTQVTQNGNVAEITGGETRGANLFHSFGDFSVPTDNIADFQNADSISNIFSRVTGGNVSNIDGMIQANGSANLFLINPAGILFGENASLNIGGSFYGSSASSILFENGKFSTDLDNPPLLTVNAPIGFSFRDNPGDITANQARLIVPDGETLALLGGNLDFDGGTYGAINGGVELGGLTESGIIDFKSDGSFNFPDAVARGDVSLANSTQIFVAGGGETTRSTNINAKNLSLNSGSFIFAGILSDLGSSNAQAGNIVINLTEDLAIDNSDITNSNAGIGNAGNVIVNARNINFTNGGTIFTFNTGVGNIGDTTLTATEDITFDGTTSNNVSGVSYFVGAEALGNIGEINLTAQNLNITNGAAISNNIEGNNDSGNINLNIADTISIDGSGFNTSADGSQLEFPSRINLTVASNGSVGDININTQNLFLSKNGTIGASIFGSGNSGNINIDAELITIGEQGTTNLPAASISTSAANSDIDNPDSIADGGQINIDTGSLRISDGGSIQAGLGGRGNGGNININARDQVLISGTSFSLDEQGQEIEIASAIFADIGETGVGEAGNIEIDTSSLVVDQGLISADVLGEGNGGSIKILASDSITLVNTGSIEAGIAASATGNAGNLTIETKQLTLTDGSQIGVSTLGNGNAGNVTINASESISLSGVNETARSGIFASAVIESGNGGDINLTTDQLTISDGATITASNFSSFGEENGGAAPGTGEPGNIFITANSLNLETEGRIEARTQSETGTGANIDLDIANNIFLSGDSFISAEAIGNANGGNLTIDTNVIVAFEGNNDMIASAEQGQGGNIDITAEALLGIKASTLNPFTSDINASSEFGLDGSVALNIPDIASLEGGTELSASVIEPGETTVQACQANREIAAKNGFVIKGKGGVPPTPEMPLNSANTMIDGEISGTIASSNLPQPIETSIGKIQPARGIKVTDKGGIVLTAYRTNNQGTRLPNIKSSCG
ncbi:MAG: filamentous hemagglutinin N-terminal domain-containing protein [Cyanobacteria bacterium P01_G01_bin.39]